MIVQCTRIKTFSKKWVNTVEPPIADLPNSGLTPYTVRVNEKLTFPHRPVSVVRKRYGSGTTYVRNRYANYACTVYGVRTESVRLRVHSLLSTEIVLRKLPSYFRMYLCASCKSNYGCVRKQLSIATTAIVTYSYCKHALVASVVSSRQNSFSC